VAEVQALNFQIYYNKKKIKQVTAVSLLCYAGALEYGRLSAMSSTKICFNCKLIGEVLSHV
jgi:hypothetical protein